MPAPLRTPELIEAVLNELRDGATLRLAAINAGISPRTLRDWRQKDPELSATLAAADAGVGAGCWKALYRAAKDGDVKAATYIIEHRFKSSEDVDEDAMVDHAARLYRLGQQMRGSVPSDPSEGPPPPKHAA